LHKGSYYWKKDEDHFTRNVILSLIPPSESSPTSCIIMYEHTQQSSGIQYRTSVEVKV
jgi:hypothetical protein